MPTDIESLEHATLAAVPPQALHSLDGWLVALDDGTVGRAHSAVPVRHAGLQEEVLDAVEACYRDRQLKPVVRLPRAPGLEAIAAELARRGFAPRQPTCTQVGEVAGVAALPAAARVELATAPAADWSAVFLGEGFDPVDGASRLAVLQRARQSLFASVVVDGRIAAVGSGCLAHGWLGIHGMRTLPAWRGRGFAGAILAALGRAAQDRGITRCFLQVEQANAGARSLYRRAGMADAWVYDYWR